MLDKPKQGRVNTVKNNLEELLKIFSDMESLECSDKLSMLVNEQLGSELDEDQLDLVSAAHSADFGRFMNYLDQKKKDNKLFIIKTYKSGAAESINWLCRSAFVDYTLSSRRNRQN